MSKRVYGAAMPVYAHTVIRFYRVHRLAFLSRNIFVRLIFCKFLNVMNWVFIQGLFHCLIPKEAEIGKNLMMPHPFGICISPNARIGSNVKIMHYVTFEYNEEEAENNSSGILVGDNVYIAPGAQIL